MDQSLHCKCSIPELRTVVSLYFKNENYWNCLVFWKREQFLLSVWYAILPASSYHPLQATNNQQDVADVLWMLQICLLKRSTHSTYREPYWPSLRSYKKNYMNNKLTIKNVQWWKTNYWEIYRTNVNVMCLNIFITDVIESLGNCFPTQPLNRTFLIELKNCCWSRR